MSSASERQRPALAADEHPHSDTPATRISAKTRTAGTLGTFAQPAANNLQSSRRASPSPPQRITTSWLYANTGRASGPITFIHAFVVRTFHS